MGKSLIILGAGGHGRVCADIAIVAGFRLTGFLDVSGTPGNKVNGIEIVGANLADLSVLPEGNKHALFIALGDNERRLAQIEKALGAGYTVPALIHPSSVISPSATIGAGSVVMAGVVINANSSVGQGCILNTCSSIDHDNVLADGVQICPGVHVAGDVHFGHKAFVGTGASIIPGVKIGANSIVGAGSLVRKNVNENAKVAGVPARAIA